MLVASSSFCFALSLVILSEAISFSFWADWEILPSAPSPLCGGTGDLGLGLFLVGSLFLGIVGERVLSHLIIGDVLL